MEEDEGLELEQPQTTRHMIQRVGLLIMLLATLAVYILAVFAR